MNVVEPSIAQGVRAQLSRPVQTAAAGLLGWHVVRALDGVEVRCRIVEVEAYGSDDPASHAAPGRTQRNTAMFAPPGTAYVFRSYGVHWCLNVVAEPEGDPAAILLRAAQVVSGVDVVRRRRATCSDVDKLLSGPGCLAAGLDITRRHDRADLVTGDRGVRIEPGPDGPPPAELVCSGPRVGVSRAADRPWRWWLADSPAVSRYRRASAAGPAGAATSAGTPRMVPSNGRDGPR